jgi:hypothetical protein
LFARAIECIVNFVDPLDIRAKSPLAGQIERQMNAEARLPGDRVDEMTKRCFTDQSKVVAFRKRPLPTKSIFF